MVSGENYISKIRNFSIIAHIDHGKSTLADRLLEITGASKEIGEQTLDMMDLERERGITIKAKTVRMEYKAENSSDCYILNLIDTPGHMDFSYEVRRTLSVCEGAILLVDGTQGVEAQTIANYELAKMCNLVIIPAINKIDMPQVDIETTKKQIIELMGGVENFPLHCISAKNGTNVKELLKTLIEVIPPPTGNEDTALDAVIFDSFYDTFRGVICIIKVLSGRLKQKDRVTLVPGGSEKYEIEEVGVLKYSSRRLKLEPVEYLRAGEIGYCVAGIKDIHHVTLGAHILSPNSDVNKIRITLPESKPYVFCSIYPINNSDFDALNSAIHKLHLTDYSFHFQRDNSPVFGYGFRCGFLGLLHLEIIKDRITREYGLDVIVTTPSVTYKIETKDNNFIEINNITHLPESNKIKCIHEPYVKITIVTPYEYLSPVMELVKSKHGEYKRMYCLSEQKAIIEYEMPLSEMIVDFIDKLKSVSKGYATFDYEHIGYKVSDLVKLEILVHHEPVEALTFLVHRDSAYEYGKKLVEKLKTLIPRHLFSIVLQARVENKIVAREDIPALRKDVLAKCYGGDVTRKRKLLEKQKEGKKRMKLLGKVEVPSDVFLEILRM
jgi:GTP-binding protein LepA